MASAPAKVILLGEHAVNRGHPALVTAVDRRTHCTAGPSPDGEVHLRAGERGEVLDLDELGRFHDRVAELVAAGDRAAVREAARTDFFAPAKYALAQLVDAPCTIEWSVGVPVGSGLGSGASAVTAALRAVAALRRRCVELSELHRLAREGDVVAHGGLATGLDTAGAVYGGVARYSVTDWAMPLDLSSLPTLVVADSGVRASTAVVNSRLQDRLDVDASLGTLFGAIGELVGEAQVALRRGDWVLLGRLMDENQAMLARLGVSIAEIDTLVARARAAGAYGAKLSGSGGGGIVVALVDPERAEAVAAACGHAFVATAGAPGARIENAGGT